MITFSNIFFGVLDFIFIITYLVSISLLGVFEIFFKGEFICIYLVLVNTCGFEIRDSLWVKKTFNFDKSSF